MKIRCSLLFLIAALGCAPSGSGTHTAAAPSLVHPSQTQENTIIIPSEGDQDIDFGNDKVLRWVDLRDQLKNKETSHLARNLWNNIEKNKDEYFPEKPQLTTEGPGFEPASRDNSLYGIEVAAAQESPNAIQFYILALASFTQGDPIFRVATLTLSKKDPAAPMTFVRGNDIPLAKTHFIASVSLIDRKVILGDPDFHIKIIYPLGVGAFDEIKPEAVSLMTPKVSGAAVDYRYSSASRTDPAIYKGRPFLRVTKEDGTYSELGFHYSITNSLRRGFISHGCMRMRDKDLYEFYKVATNSSRPLKVNINLMVSDLSDHPYPKIDDRYWRIRNFGTAEDPEIRRDDHKLTILEQINSSPPLNVLINNIAPDSHLSGE